MTNTKFEKWISALTGRHSKQDHMNGDGGETLRIYAVGDIHGRRDLLDDLLLLIEEDAGDRPHQIIFLGDYVDRGKKSAQVIDKLISLENDQTRNVICLKGNHEQSMLKFMEDPVDNIDWLDWGGDETLRSYGLNKISVRDPSDLADTLKQVMPASHLSFLQNLKIRHQYGPYVFVHAGLKPGVALEEQTERDQLWIRKEFEQVPKNLRPEHIVVHGHVPGKKVVDKGWRICVDTGAFWTGILSAIVLEGRQKRIIATSEST